MERLNRVAGREIFANETTSRDERYAGILAYASSDNAAESYTVFPRGVFRRASLLDDM